MSEIVEATARALYERERERSLLCESVVSRAVGKPIKDTMEPWDEVADMYRRDAEIALEAACDAITWTQIHAYHKELRRGQDIYEDAGGFFRRAIRALLGKSSPDPVVSYREAARALIREAS
jgi:hypothetical protein